MKKSIFSVFVIAAAAIALVSCNKEVPQNSEAPLQKASTVSFVASQPDTKAAFGTQSGSTLPTLWTSNDKEIFAALNFTAESGFYDFPALTPSSDGKTAYFDATLQNDESGEYVFSLFSPSSAIYNIEQYTHTDGSVYNLIEYTIPSVQTPETSSPDEAAMILATNTDKLSAWPTEQLDVTFHHLTSYLKLDLQNLDLDVDENVTSVVISADANLAGTFAVDLEQGAGFYIEASGTVVVNTNGDNPVWVACNPIGEGTVLTITAKTDANYQYSVDFTTPADLPAGTVAEVTVDYDGIMGSEVLFSYEDWLGTYTIDRDGTNTDTWTIGVDVSGSSYYIDGIESLGVGAYAKYDASTGNMVLSLQEGLYNYTDEEYGDMSVGLFGIITISGKNYYVTGDYDIFVASWDNDAHSSATLTPQSVDVGDPEPYTLSGFRFFGICEAGALRYDEADAFTHLPNTLIRSAASSAPKPSGLLNGFKANQLVGNLVEGKSLQAK